MLMLTSEEWAPIAGWAYEAGSLGHIRRRPRQGRRVSRLIPPKPDADGYQHVVLRKGQNEQTFRVDTLICQAFHGKPAADMIVEHSDGVAWNDWRTNLRWSYPVMATHWYCGPIEPATRGYFRYGPFTSKRAACEVLQFGHVLVGKDGPAGTIVAFEFALERGTPQPSVNPFGLARYWRATVTGLLEMERAKGRDIVTDKDPFEAAQRYKELADMHPEFMWAVYLHEAAFFIEQLASMVYHKMAPPPAQVVPAAPRSRFKPAEPSHTDLMISPEAIDEVLKVSTPPRSRTPFQAKPLATVIQTGRRRECSVCHETAEWCQCDPNPFVGSIAAPRKPLPRPRTAPSGFFSK